MSLARLLEVKDLKVQFKLREGAVHAVEGVSFSLDEGEALGSVGEGGSGKSVRAFSILRLLPVPPAQIKEGSVMFGDQDLLEMSESELRKIRGGQIAMIFQDPISSLNPVLRIEQQIIEPLQIHLGLSKSEARGPARELMEAFRIPDAARRLRAYPHQFIGRMRPRPINAMPPSC